VSAHTTNTSTAESYLRKAMASQSSLQFTWSLFAPSLNILLVVNDSCIHNKTLTWMGGQLALSNLENCLYCVHQIYWITLRGVLWLSLQICCYFYASCITIRHNQTVFWLTPNLSKHFLQNNQVFRSIHCLTDWCLQPSITQQWIRPGLIFSLFNIALSWDSI